MIYNSQNKNPKKVTLLCLGPLTNLALALKTYTEIQGNIKEVFVMGGNVSGCGNATRCAEYNFYADPESAHIVLESAKCPVTIVPWEPCMQENIVGISMVSPKDSCSLGSPLLLFALFLDRNGG